MQIEYVPGSEKALADALFYIDSVAIYSKVSSDLAKKFRRTRAQPPKSIVLMPAQTG